MPTRNERENKSKSSIQDQSFYYIFLKFSTYENLRNFLFDNQFFSFNLWSKVIISSEDISKRLQSQIFDQRWICVLNCIGLNPENSIENLFQSYPISLESQSSSLIIVTSCSIQFLRTVILSLWRGIFWTNRICEKFKTSSLLFTQH